MENKAIPNQRPIPMKVSQHMVLDALLSGKTISEAAMIAGIGRTSIHRWFREDFAFVAEFNRCRQELRDAILTRLEGLAGQAVTVVEQSIARGDVKSAISVLRGLGLLNGEAVQFGSGEEDVAREEAFNLKLSQNPRWMS